MTWTTKRAIDNQQAPKPRDPQEDAETRAAIRGLLDEEPFYHARVRGQGYTGYRFLIWVNGKEYESTWLEDRARTAVHTGTIKALTTDSLPEQVTRAWVHAIDTNARRDYDRAEARENARRGKLPSDAAVPRPDEVYERKETIEHARRYLIRAVIGAGVDARTFTVIAHRLARLKPASWRDLSRGSGISYKTLQYRAEAAMAAMQEALGGIDHDLLTRLFISTLGVLGPGENPQLADFLDGFPEHDTRTSLVVDGGEQDDMNAAVVPSTEGITTPSDLARRVIEEVGPAPKPAEGDDFNVWLLQMVRAWARHYLADTLAPEGQHDHYLSAVKPLIDAGGIDLAIRVDAEGWPYVDDLVVPALFLEVELTRLAGAGRIAWEDIPKIRRQTMPTIEGEWAKIEADAAYCPNVTIQLGTAADAEQIPLQFFDHAIDAFFKAA